MWRRASISLRYFALGASLWLPVALAVAEHGDDARTRKMGKELRDEQGHRIHESAAMPLSNAVMAYELPVSDGGECENAGRGYAPEAAYELILTTREALDDYGILVSSEVGRPVHFTYRDRVAVPPIPDWLSGEAQRDELLKKKFSLQPRDEVVLVQIRGLERALVCGTCFRGGRYSVVQLKSTKRDSHGRKVYTFERLIHPWWRPQILTFSIAAESVIIKGRRQPRVGTRALMACVRSGDIPILFPRFLSSAAHLFKYVPGPFREEVTAQDVAVFSGINSRTAVVKATLTQHGNANPVVHRLRENSSFLFFGTISAASPFQNAFVLGSIKKDSRCTVERSDVAGPVTLFCSEWKSLAEYLAGWAISAARPRKSLLRRVALGAFVAAAVVSGYLAFSGYSRSTVEQMTAMREARFRTEFSTRIRQRYGFDRSLVATFANSADPVNIQLAAASLLQSNLTPGTVTKEVREGCKGLLMRAAGLAGLAAVATAIAAVLSSTLAGKVFRASKARWWLRHRLERQVAGSVERALHGRRKSEREPEKRKGFLFAVVA
ncbi:hypothetical protein BESB_014960 [Besnoitia besnoiti]|uniref:Transmembrane protein n=1 Tax=Besnoitia besnoiti TaxID=94643 RepID=A0A2A9MB30_BESBE|nr:hypothetical protein BESB_014960 [Besnoitia besnoiti]PFH32883.1 hypothetical protein BESB_014960 [Besnoitia besnoiti]